MTQERAGENQEAHEVRELMGPLPGWGLRWGITAIGLGAAAFLLLAWLVKYPDVVEARVAILAEAPPVRLLARQDGQLSRLLAADQQPVEAGQLLAVLENPAALADVERLAAWIDAAEQGGLPEALFLASLPAGLRLGDLQATYAALAQSQEGYLFFRQQAAPAQRAASLRVQAEHLRQLNVSLEKQGQTLAQETELARRNYQRNQDLIRTGGASQADVEEAQSQYLQRLRQLEALEAEQWRNQAQIEALQSRLIELSQERAEQGAEQAQAAQRQFRQLKAELAAWQQRHLIVAPVAGRLSLAQPWSEWQYIRENELFGAVVPEQSRGGLTAKGLLPAAGAGKARPGMAAHLQLDAYPYREFGMIKGELRRIALLPEQGSYLIEIALPDSLVTSYGRVIPFAQELGAKAEVITEDRRLLERVLEQILALLRRD